jgi:hypothetical protein
MAAPTGTLMVAPLAVLMVVMANLMVAETTVPASLIVVLMVVPMVAPMDVPLIPKRFHVAILWLSKAKLRVPTKTVERPAVSVSTVTRTLLRQFIVQR